MSDIYCNRDTPGSIRSDPGANWRECTSLGNNVTPTSPDEIVMTVHAERGKVQDLKIAISPFQGDVIVLQVYLWG